MTLSGAEPPAKRVTFRDVRREIERRIAEGPWGPGTSVPGEVALAAEFGCSRSTISRAMREIAGKGLIDRRRKTGTRVRLAPTREARFTIPLVRAAIEAVGSTYGYRLLTRRVAPPPGPVAERFGDNMPALHVRCLHLADRAGWQVEDRWISLAALPEAENEAFAVSGPNEWLVATAPFSEVEISFLAVEAGEAETRHLGHSPHGPVFCIERATWWRGNGITSVRLTHRPDYRMTTRY